MKCSQVCCAPLPFPFDNFLKFIYHAPQTCTYSSLYVSQLFSSEIYINNILAFISSYISYINAQSASLRSLVAAESTLQQPMQPARDHPLFLCGFWMCILSIVDWNKSVPQFLGVWPWSMTFRGHLRSKIFSPFESHDFLSNFYWHFLSVLYRFWDIRFQSFQALTWTFKGHLRSKIFSPFESPYMTSYPTSIDTFSLSHTIFEIFDFKVFRVWPWPLEVTWGQKYFHHLKAHTWLLI